MVVKFTIGNQTYKLTPEQAKKLGNELLRAANTPTKSAAPVKKAPTAQRVTVPTQRKAMPTKAPVTQRSVAPARKAPITQQKSAPMQDPLLSRLFGRTVTVMR